MTIDDALAEARARIGGESAAADARILMGKVLGCDGAWLLAHGDEPLEDGAQERFLQMVSRRAIGVPVAFLIKEAWFYGRRFDITREVLVPRPETETLVAEALAFLRERKPPARDVPVNVCDVGTGSGIIAITLALEMPAIVVDAIDVSGAALEVARRNAVTYDVDGRVRCSFGETLDGLSLGTVYDCIVANLPYVPGDDIPEEPDPLAFEPRIALDGGFDGLAVYRQMLRRVRHLLAPDGALFLEAAPPTIGRLAELVAEALPDAEVSIVPDAGALDRVVAARRRPNEREAAKT